MAKVDIDLVAEVLQMEPKLDPTDAQRVLRKLIRAAERAAEKAAAEREAPVKKQFVLVVSDPRGEIPDEDFVGWVFQVPENDSPMVATERLIRAAHNFNTSPRGRKHPARTFAEACEVVSPKMLKECLVSVKTRLPVTVVRTDNVLPPDKEGKISLDDLRRT